MPRPGPESQTVSLGESARVVVYNAILCVKRGTVTEDPGEILTTCTGGGGFSSRTRQPRNLVADIEAQWKTDQNPFSNPPNIIPGEDVSSVHIYPDYDVTPSVKWYMPTAYVQNAVMTFDAEMNQNWTMQLKNQGMFGTPAQPIV